MKYLLVVIAYSIDWLIRVSPMVIKPVFMMLAVIFACICHACGYKSSQDFDM